MKVPDSAAGADPSKVANGPSSAVLVSVAKGFVLEVISPVNREIWSFLFQLAA